MATELDVILDMILPLLLAAVLGAGIGYQRERAGKPAGLRTYTLISLGAALFTIASIYAFGAGSDPSRVAAGVVVGIGFLGAGAIVRGFRGDGGVAGLTTAASIWVVAAVGLTAGAGMYLLSAIAALITWIVLSIPKVRG
jgi:putative Mg2+ transporter-C (MgtC) family protein